MKVAIIGSRRYENKKKIIDENQNKTLPTKTIKIPIR